MPYPEMMIQGMRQELAQLGIEETKTPEAVKDAVENTDGTLMVVVNSVCGCAAGGVRPGIAMALQNSPNKPDRAVTVFAGADIEATAKARSYFAPYRPSSPQIALFKDGKLVYMIERHQIEGRQAQEIAQELTRAFDQHCTPASAVTA